MDEAQLERLALLTEEAGEISQAVGKILRWGWESVHPSRPEAGNNRDRLVEEIGDILSIVYLMLQEGDFTSEQLDDRMTRNFFEKDKHFKYNKIKL